MTNKYQEIIIDKKYEGLRLDRFLFSIFSNINNILLQKAIRNKDILLNNSPTKNNAALKNNDVVMLSNFIVKIFTQPSKIVKAKRDIEFTDAEIQKIKEQIIYKDKNILAINKPAGLAVQSGTKIEKSLNDFLPFLKYENEEIPKLVHRIDKDTSGVLILARDRKNAELLNEYFKEKGDRIEKIYLAVVVGKFSKPTGEINFPLLKKLENGVEKVYRDEKDGKEAITLYKVLGYSDKYNVSLLEVKILTGRTHQIRVHMKEIGHPIVGDGKYGGKKAYIDGLNSRLHLHSYRTTLKALGNSDVVLQAPLPKHIQKTLDDAFGKNLSLN